MAYWSLVQCGLEVKQTKCKLRGLYDGVVDCQPVIFIDSSGNFLSPGPTLVTVGIGQERVPDCLLSDRLWHTGGYDLCLQRRQPYKFYVVTECAWLQDLESHYVLCRGVTGAWHYD